MIMDGCQNINNKLERWHVWTRQLTAAFIDWLICQPRNGHLFVGISGIKEKVQPSRLFSARYFLGFPVLNSKNIHKQCINHPTSMRSFKLSRSLTLDHLELNDTIEEKTEHKGRCVDTSLASSHLNHFKVTDIHEQRKYINRQIVLMWMKADVKYKVHSSTTDVWIEC